MNGSLNAAYSAGLTNILNPYWVEPARRWITTSSTALVFEALSFISRLSISRQHNYGAYGGGIELDLEEYPTEDLQNGKRDDCSLDMGVVMKGFLEDLCAQLVSGLAILVFTHSEVTETTDDTEVEWKTVKNTRSSIAFW